MTRAWRDIQPTWDMREMWSRPLSAGGHRRERLPVEVAPLVIPHEMHIEDRLAAAHRRSAEAAVHFLADVDRMPSAGD